MKLEQERAERRIFARRAALLLGVKAAAAAGLGARLFQLQVLERSRYADRAEQIRVDLRLITPPRGRIFDREGGLLAGPRPTYGVFLRLGRWAAVEADLERLQRLLALSPAQTTQLRLRAAQARGREIELLDDVGWDAFARIAANAPALRRIQARQGAGRVYPGGAAAAHVVGYVGAVTREDRAADPDPLLRLAGARIGRSGVERAREAALRGGAGARRVEIDAFQRDMRALTHEPPTAGQDLTLTLDAELQRAAAARLRGQSGAAVVMDVRSGDLLAMASSPSFDPNTVASGISYRQWRALNEDPQAPLLDRSAAGLYPPGSTFKMMTALAALEAGALDPAETIECRGKIDFGDRVFHCWRPEGHGHVALRAAITGSCDVYFYEMARRAGAERIARMARRFGAGEPLPIDAPQARPGVAADPDWKRRSGGGAWVGGDTLNIGVGQGAMLMSPVQLATMTARLAHGDGAVAPRLVRAIGGVPIAPPPPPPLGVRAEHLALMREAMTAAVMQRGGTAYAARIIDAAHAMAGKTGTSQVRAISAAERAAGVRDNASLPRRLRDHALFVAYAPIDAPRYAAAVVVEHGGSGARVAAPIARDLLLQAQFGGPAPLSAYPEAAREAVERRRAAEPPMADDDA